MTAGAMTAEERYLFDLQGYLVIKEVLGAGELQELNRLLDDHDLSNRPRGEDLSFDFWQNDEHQVSAGPLHMWDEPFRRLIAHPTIVGYLTEILGPRFRYDHGHAMVMSKGGRPFRLHGGGTPWDNAIAYEVSGGHIRCGLVVVHYALCDVGPADGGFCALPGSHKSSFPCPDSFKPLTDPGPSDHARAAEGRICRAVHRGPHPRHPALDRGPRAPGALLPVHAGSHGLRRALPGGRPRASRRAPIPGPPRRRPTIGRPWSAACWSRPYAWERPATVTE